MTTVDQQTRRRMARTGLTALDEAKACPGYVLYAPLDGPGTVLLIDLGGEAAHQWDLPYPPGDYGYLLPNGNLFYMGKVHDETWDLWPTWHHFKGGVLLEVDWHGKVVWEHRDPYQHHDARRTPSGGAIYLTVEPVPEDMAASTSALAPRLLDSICDRSAALMAAASASCSGVSPRYSRQTRTGLAPSRILYVTSLGISSSPSAVAFLASS